MKDEENKSKDSCLKRHAKHFDEIAEHNKILEVMLGRITNMYEFRKPFEITISTRGDCKDGKIENAET